MKKHYSDDIIDKNTPDVQVRQCCFKSCEQEGMYPAPKSRQHLQQRYWFCLEHVRKYNASWNFFGDMDEAQIQSFQKEAMAGHRPTWKIGFQPTQMEKKILDRLASTLTGNLPKSPPPLPTNERNALAALNLDYPTTLKDIKKRYKELVKQYHPDVSKNNQHAETKFVTISTAYHYLVNCGYFTS